LVPITFLSHKQYRPSYATIISYSHLSETPKLKKYLLFVWAIKLRNPINGGWHRRFTPPLWRNKKRHSRFRNQTRVRTAVNGEQMTRA